MIHRSVNDIFLIIAAIIAIRRKSILSPPIAIKINCALSFHEIFAKSIAKRRSPAGINAMGFIRRKVIKTSVYIFSHTSPHTL